MKKTANKKTNRQHCEYYRCFCCPTVLKKDEAYIIKIEDLLNSPNFNTFLDEFMQEIPYMVCPDDEGTRLALELLMPSPEVAKSVAISVFRERKNDNVHVCKKCFDKIKRINRKSC